MSVTFAAFSNMSAAEAMTVSGNETPAPAVSPAAAKASPPQKRGSQPKIDLDDEIRRANDLATMSRKMLQAARNVARNNRKAKQRLIKKAGKLSPQRSREDRSLEEMRYV